MPNKLDAAIKLLKAAKKTVVFTGAGMSAESGIPTYRDTDDGLWTKYDPDKYANINTFMKDSSYYWNFFKDVRSKVLLEAKPNAGHKALAEMEKCGRLDCTITQNIDGLHQLAGSKKVLELHGNTRVIHCLECSERYTAEKVSAWLKTQLPPVCPACKGMLKPAVVFFGENLPTTVLEEAFTAATQCDVFIVVGSSLVVQPAATLPVHAKGHDSQLIIINQDPTPLDHVADLVLKGQSGAILPEIAKSL